MVGEVNSLSSDIVVKGMCSTAKSAGRMDRGAYDTQSTALHFKISIRWEKVINLGL